MNRSQTGFTLIELVVVITILGVLAAVALPKFTNLQRDARIAKLNGARASVAAASALVHGAYLARLSVADAAACPADTAASPVAATNTANGTLCTEAGLVQLANGYPASATALAATTPGIVGAAGLSTSVYSPSLAELNAEGFGASVAAGATTISVIGGANTVTTAGAQLNANCAFTYTAAAANAAPTISAVTTTGC